MKDHTIYTNNMVFVIIVKIAKNKFYKRVLYNKYM